MKEALPPELATGLQKAMSASDCPEWLRLLLTMLVTLLESLQKEVREHRKMAEEIEKLRAENADLKANAKKARKKEFGPKSERGTGSSGKTGGSASSDKVPPQPKAPRNGPAAMDRAELPEEVIEHPVPPELLHCPLCNGRSFVAMPPDDSTEIELVLEHVKRLIHRRQKMACKCGGHIVTAPGPERVTEGGRYGAGMHAWLLVRRCMDGIPLNRLADILRRSSAPISVSTLNDLFHAAAAKLLPLYELIVARIRGALVVHGDETPFRVVAPFKCEIAFLWVFTSQTDVLIVHSESRSGDTPMEILRDSTGFLVADGYTGYNQVTETQRRKRQGCMTHARRKFKEAQHNHPFEARWMLGHIALLYAMEAQIKCEKLQGTLVHKTVRDGVCRQITQNMRSWLDEQKQTVRPKSLLGIAIRYMHKQWARLTLFLDHVELPMDNNPAERELRRPVIGRKNSLFAKNHDSARRYAIASTLVLTCRKLGVDPIQYLIWVLPRIGGHSQHRLHELLPHACQEVQLAA